ncbi:MAG: hypothetical protein LCH96_08425 [Actinobacteria bacterium]|nr:hypothetical protein [Actinomycetota bacterium]
MAREFFRGVVRAVLAAGLCTAALAAVPPVPASADWLGAQRALTTGDGIRQWPSVSGHRVAYVDHADDRMLAGLTSFDIRVLDLATGRDRLLTPEPTATGPASISGDRVVWPDRGAGDPGIWLADLDAGTSRRLDVHPGDNVTLSGTRLCYEYDGRVWAADLRTGRDTAVSPATATASSCDVSGNLVVWQDDRGGDLDIYARNLATGVETVVTDDPADQSMSAVDDDVVVWQDASNGPNDLDIAALDLRTGTRTAVADEASSQFMPDVSDGRVVWMDERLGHGNTEIYAYDLASDIETRVTTAEGWSGDPAISGGRIVYEDVTGRGHNLYQRVLTPPQLSISLASDPDGGLAAVSGFIYDVHGVPVVSADLVLETSADGRLWQGRGMATTAGDGSYTFVVPEIRGSGRIRVRAPGSPEYPEGVSRTLRLPGPGIVSANAPR